MSSKSNTGFIKGVFAALSAIAALVAIYEFVTKPSPLPPPVATRPVASEPVERAPSPVPVEPKTTVIVVTATATAQAMQRGAVPTAPTPADAAPNKVAPDVYSKEGFSYYFNRQYEQAISKFKACVAAYPSYGDCYNGLGMAYREVGDYQQALPNHDKAISISPRYDYYFERGVTYHQNSNYDKAISDFRVCLEKNPSFGNCAVRLGMAYRDIGNFQQALLYHDKAIELGPNRGDFYWERGITYERMGNNSQAEVDKKKARDLGYNQ